MRKKINEIFRRYYQFRYRRIERFMKNPHKAQKEILRQLIEAAKHTEWGRQYNYRRIKTPEQFANSVPIQNYETLKPYIQRMMYGEKDVLWSGQVKWFSKSSGTTSDKSKFIPVSNRNLKTCHIRGSWDTMNLYYHNRPAARQFELKSLVMGGSLTKFEHYPQTTIGDVSAIMINRIPTIVRPFYTPDFETALLPEWEEKLEKMAQIASCEPNVVMIGGVPTWTVVLLRRILEITGKPHMLEVWPHFQVYIHGGVSFSPYKRQFEQFFPSDKVDYQEIYNASEGYFAIQNNFESKDMLLLLDNGIYYEFIPMSEWHREKPKAIPLSEVEIGKNYALVISTNSGLWRYTPGDTITFTSTQPYKIKVTGRTKQFVNAFGEEVMVENTDKALAMTCAALDTLVLEYTVAPVYFDEEHKAGHEWIIEFENPPLCIETFNQLLDQNLQKVNSDYEAKRYRDMALTQLRLRIAPSGTFHQWMAARGKLGGQHKVPRLANHRKYIEEILDFMMGQRVSDQF